MTYDPHAYWPERYKRQGKTYVAKGGRQSAYDAEYEAVAPFLALHATGKVLDFGCGVGRFRGVLESVCDEYVGVDLIPGLGAQSVSDILGGFNTVVATFVLQHIVADEDYGFWVGKLHSRLRPAGRLLVVDHLPRQGMDPHMHPRGIDGILDASEWADYNVVGEWNGHWMGWVER